MKKFLCVVLALAMAISLVACGSGASSSAASTAGSAAASAAEGGVLKIGATGPVTGGAAVYGQSVKNGAELAVAEINAAGGINGMQIEFQFEDDEADGEKAVNAYNTLKDWGMQVLMGTVTSGACLNVAPEAANDGMFELTPSASNADVVAGDNCFQVCFTDPNQGIASADYIADNQLATKVAVIYDSSDAYSSGIYAKFAEEAAAKGLEIVSAESFTADNKTDFSVQVSKAASAEAELLFLPIYYTEANLIIQEANKEGFAPIVFGCDGLDGLLDIEGANISLFQDVMLLTPFAADAADEKTQSFVAAYKAAYTDTPTQFAADAFDAIYVIKAAAEQAGITADMSVTDMGAALSAAMTEISVDGLTGEGMTWAATGEVNKSPRAVKINIDGETGSYVSAQ